MPFGETKPNCLGRTKGGGVQFIDENGGGPGVRLRTPIRPLRLVANRSRAAWLNPHDDANFVSNRLCRRRSPIKRCARGVEDKETGRFVCRIIDQATSSIYQVKGSIRNASNIRRARS